MWKNKKGAALMQVLLAAIILAGIAAMLLRFSLSRSTSARKTRRAVLAETLIQSCMGEVNALWNQKLEKDLQVFQKDIDQHCFYCGVPRNPSKGCPAGQTNGKDNCVREYKCQYYAEGSPYRVTATMDAEGKITYEVTEGSGIF